VLFRKRVSALYKKEMVEIFNTMSEYLPAKPLAILDIGAGMGGIDLVLYHHYNNKPNLYLLDKDGVSEKINAGFNKTAEDFSHYNSFAHAKLFLTDNNVPADHIHTINISSEAFPTEQKFDLVISLLSWGFHYPISTYVQEVYDSLQSGGSLIIDVRKDTDGISELTKMFNSTPETIYEENKFVRVAVRKK